MSSHWYKTIQRKLYDVLNKRWGPPLVLAIASILLCTIAHILFAALQFAVSHRSCSSCSFSNNIGHRSFQNELCTPTFDAVYTWVNGSDPKLREQIAFYRAEDGELADSEAIAAMHNAHAESIKEPDGPPIKEDIIDQAKHGANRFRDNEELRYSLRSIWMFAPWIRDVYIVTNGQVPSWLDVTYPHVHIVTHSDIFVNKSHLPVFSSPAIEVHLHRIKSLSDQFIYFNDDTMIGAPIWPDDFWTRQSGQKVYLSWDVPQCNPGCPDAWLNDNYCDPICNTSSCVYDEGDCLGDGVKSRGPDSWMKNHRPPPVAPSAGSTADIAHSTAHEVATQSYCGTGCPNSWLGDKVCDRACKITRCGFDAGDCGPGLVREHVPRYDLVGNDTTITIPHDQMSAFVDMNIEVPHLIVAAEHECESFMRSAIIVQTEKMLILVMLPAIELPATCTVAIFSRETVANSNITIDYSLSFNIIREGSLPPSSEIVSPAIVAYSSENQQLDSDDNEDHTFTMPDSDAINLEPGSIVPDGEDADDVADVVGNDLAEDQTVSDVTTKEDLTIGQHDFAASERHLLSAIFPAERDFTQVLMDTLIEGVPSRRFPNGIALKDEMNEDEWALAGFYLDQKRSQLFSLEKSRLEASILAHLSTSNGPVWPWEFHQMQGLSASPIDQSVHNRQLLDAFGDSLRYVTRIYNAYFSVQGRKVPAHMPHMLDRNIVDELQSIWPEQFDATSAHRFRSPTDMQCAFSYFYYLIEKRETFDVPSFFQHEIDLDNDGYVSEMELRHLSNVHRQLRFADITNRLINCSVNLAAAKGTTLQPDEGVSVTAATVENCPEIIALFKPIVEQRRYYAHQKMPMDQVTFYMIGDNATVVRHRLEEILVERKKFVCLNDDMKDPEPGVSEALNDFFNSYYPNRSPFELPAGTNNPYLHISELRAYHRRLSILYFFMQCGVICIVIILINRKSPITAWVRPKVKE